MADTVTVTWTDSTGTYTNTFNVENPTLDEVKDAFTFQMGITPLTTFSSRPKSEDEFYSKLSEDMLNRVLAQVQQTRQQRAQQVAMQAVPAIVLTPVDKVEGTPVQTLPVQG